MTPLEIYTIAGGGRLRVIQCHRGVHGTAAWSSIEKMCIAFSVLIVRQLGENTTSWTLSVAFSSCPDAGYRPYTCTDNDYSNVAQVHEVDNVPVGLAIWRR